MRTTLTLDDDVAVRLRREVRKSGLPFKQVVNGLLRTSLSLQQEAAAAPPFRVEARRLGLQRELSYDCIPALLEQLEDGRR